MTLLIAATGGTIASLPDPETQAVRPAVSAEDLVAGVPQLGEIDELEVVEVDRVNGWNMTPETMLSLAGELGVRLADPAVQGAVVTHGTDTVEETAFLCDLLVHSDKPVAFAAAMRSGDELGADGPRNLVNAARVASSREARGWGSLVVMNDEVHAARWCVKLDSHRASAFASPGHGPVGHVTGSRFMIAPALARFTIEPPERGAMEVAVVKAFTGMSPKLIEAVADASGAAGMVIEGTGAGNVPGSAMEGIAAVMERGIPVVIATRAVTGGVVPIYGGPGGGVTLREMGMLSAGALTVAKSRLLLMAALARADERRMAVDLFREGVNALAPGPLGT